jgi:hypothetical protein
MIRFFILALICVSLPAASHAQRSSHFTVSSAARLDPKEARQLLSLLEWNRTTLASRLASAGIETRFPEVEVFVNRTTGDFVGRTGMPAWAAAATRNRHIELQPLSLLKRRGLLETTLRHELVHLVVDTLGGDQTPRWLAEGIALYVAGEGKSLERYATGPAVSPSELERQLATAKSAAELKSAYAAAYKTVQGLIRIEGENKLWQRVAQRSYDVGAPEGRAT